MIAQERLPDDIVDMVTHCFRVVAIDKNRSTEAMALAGKCARYIADPRYDQHVDEIINNLRGRANGN
jgi:hypothetical protein